MDTPVTREEFIRETDKIHSRLNHHESKIAVLETVIKNFEGLPSAISNLDKTMILVQANLEQLNKKVDELVAEERDHEKENSKQDEKIIEIENHSKVDILEFLKNKWWEIMLFVAMVVLLLKDGVK